MDGDTQHHHLQFSPVLIGLMGVLAGAIVVAIYQCLVNNCCCSQMHIQNAIAQQQNQRQGLQINQNSRTPSVTTASTTSTTTNSSNYSRALQLIPAYKYSKECKEGTCTVCLSDFNDGEAIRVLPECMHMFHVGCIDMWLSSHSNCPLCRTDVLPPQPRHVVLRLPNSDVVPPPQPQPHPQHQHVVISISNRFTMPNFSGGSHMTT